MQANSHAAADAASASATAGTKRFFPQHQLACELSASPSDVNATAGELPSSKRRRLADEQTSDGQGNEATAAKESESLEECKSSNEGAADTTSSESPTATPAAAAALVKPKSHRGRQADVAAPSSHVIGSIACCDLDLLSVVLSMLSSDDFLTAIRVNKHFYAARLRKSAWPTLQLDSFIQSLNDDDYDNPSRRRLRVHATKALLPHFAAMLPPADGDGAPAALATNMWRHVSDAHVYSRHEGSCWPDAAPQPDASALLPQLAQLPFLTAISFHQVSISLSTFFKPFAELMVSRLQVLMVSGSREHLQDWKHIGLLRSLRVLSVDQLPDATALLQLQQLEYLHCSEAYDARIVPVATAIRHLSSSYALRSLSLHVYSDIRCLLPMVCGSAPPQHWPAHFHTVEPNPTAQLVDWTRPCGLTALALSHADMYWRRAVVLTAESLPALVLLRVHLTKGRRIGLAQRQPDPEGSHSDEFDFPLPPLDLFSRLHQLCLEINEADLLQHVAHCSHLRRLQLSASDNIRVPAKMLCAIVQANAGTLEEFRLCLSESRCSEKDSGWPTFTPAIQGDPHSRNPADDEGGMDRWSVLADCPRLRVVELPSRTDVAPQLLAALSKAPSFQSLDLRLPPLVSPRLRALLPCALASSSWCSIRFLCARTVQLSSSADVEGLLPADAAVFDSSPSGADSRSSRAQLPSTATLQRLRIFIRRAADSERCFMLHSTSAGSLEWQQLKSIESASAHLVCRRQRHDLSLLAVCASSFCQTLGYDAFHRTFSLPIESGRHYHRSPLLRVSPPALCHPPHLSTIARDSDGLREHVSCLHLPHL